jgi:hypothetical protein
MRAGPYTACFTNEPWRRYGTSMGPPGAVRAFFSRLRIPLLLLPVVLATGVLPAGAGIRADVNRDGHLDAVRVGNNRTTITIVFGGTAARQVLRSVDALTCLALSDVDADGDLDIVGTSERHGILLWRNTGRGRFVPSAASRLRWMMRRAGPRIDRGGGSPPPSDPALTDGDQPAIAERQSDAPCESSIRASRFSVQGVRAALAVTTESRAPPASSFR